MKKLIGYFLIASVFIGLFSMTVLEKGFIIALSVWGTAIFLSAVIFLAVWLIDQ